MIHYICSICKKKFKSDIEVMDHLVEEHDKTSWNDITSNFKKIQKVDENIKLGDS